MNSKYIYKYCPADSAVSIIKYNSFLMKNPTDFNDPFECCPQAVHSTLDIHKEDLMRRENLKKYYDEAVKNGFSGDIQHYIDWLTDRGIFDNIYNQVKRDKRKLAELAFTLAEGYAKEVRMTCFSKNPNSVLMWAHYADQQKGCILAFSRHISKRLYDVKYSKERPPIEFKDVDQVGIDAKKLLITKSSIWKYERETRLIISDSECERNEQGNACFYFEPFMLCGIAYGAKMSKSDENEIDQALEQKGIADYVHRAITMLHPFKYEIQVFGAPDIPGPEVWPILDSNYD